METTPRRKSVNGAIMQLLLRTIMLLLAATSPLSAAAAAAACSSYDTVQIQLKWPQQAQFAGYMVAAENGFYREQCLEVYIRPGGPNIIMEEEVVANRAQFGIDWLSSMLTQREAGHDVELIAQVFTRSANIEITWADSLIRQPKDLIDKNVCVWLGGNELSLRALFDANDLTWDTDLSVNRAAGSSANLITQTYTETEFLARRCDAAAATRYNELALVLETVDPNSPTGELYQEEQLFVFDYNHHNVSTLEDGIFASREWLAQPGNRDIAVRFLRASLKGWLYARDFPEETNRNVFSSNVHQRWMNNEVSKLVFPHWSGGFGVAPRDALQASADRALLYGVLTRRTMVDEFWRDDIAIEAQAGYNGELPGVARVVGWPASPSDGVLGSSDVLGESYIAPKLRFCFNNGALDICEGVRKQDASDFLSKSSGAGIAVAVLAALLLLCIVATTILLVLLREAKNIIAASLPFCLIICAGSSILVSSVFASLGQADTHRCHLRVWLLCVGFVLMMGSFVIKVRRIDAIFNNKILTAVKLTNDLLYKQVAGVLAVELLLLAVFSAVSGYQAESFNDPSDGERFHTQCRMDEGSSAGPAMVGLLFAYKIAILLYGILLAYQTRDVNSAYNESKYLAAAVYNMFFISAIVVSIVAFMGMSPQNQVLVSNLGVIFGVALSFLAKFGPKLRTAWVGAPSPYEQDGHVTPFRQRQGMMQGQPVSVNVQPHAASMSGGPPSALPLYSKAALRGLSKEMLQSHSRMARLQMEQALAELRARGHRDLPSEVALTDDAAADCPGAGTDRCHGRTPSNGPVSQRSTVNPRAPVPRRSYAPTAGFSQTAGTSAGVGANAGSVLMITMTGPALGSSPSPSSSPEPPLPGATDAAAASALTGQTESVVAQFVPSLPFPADERLIPQQADLSEAV